MLENVNMNIRKDERCVFERCSLRKTFCDLPCVHSYVIYVSIIVVSLITILMLNSDPSVNIRERLRMWEKRFEMFLCVKSLPFVQSYTLYVSLSRATDSRSHFCSHLSLPFFQKKKWKKCEILKKMKYCKLDVSFPKRTSKNQKYFHRVKKCLN